MALENMTLDQVEEALIESVGATGNAQLRETNGLYVQREENTGWSFVGTVEDVDAAQQAIDDYFNH